MTVPTATVAPARSRSHADRGPSRWLLAPALLLFGVFGVLPLVGTFALSLTKWSGLGTPQWIGLGNWANILADPVTGTTIIISLKVMIGSWLIQTPLSLLLGVYIGRFGKFRAFLAVLYFVPLLLSSAAVAFIYKYLLDANFGLFADRGLGFLHQDYLGNQHLVLGVVTFIIAWHFVPLHTLLYQGGVRQIPASLYEAAAI
ncbi:MAG: sugar ABC transporter permease, partial [Propionibacteriaceae bacterium]|nr:sugar ABC transporter permease [Propionibacteriaceae bacterium]